MRGEGRRGGEVTEVEAGGGEGLAEGRRGEERRGVRSSGEGRRR